MNEFMLEGGTLKQCSTCGEFFKHRSSLYKHRKKLDMNEFMLEGGTLKLCLTCGDFFKHRSSLYKHMKKTGHE